MRLVREQDQPAPAAPVESDLLQQQLDAMEEELEMLRSEVSNLRRRDETLNFYMSRLDEEMRLAARLQQDFLPKQLPQFGHVHFHSLFRPAGYVSGDLYDVMRLDEKHIGFFLADAVGHGMPAALLTMFIKRALVTKDIRAGGYRLLKPSEAMARLNDSLVEQNLSQATFATALYGMINIETNELTFASGGHPAPVLLRHDGSMQPVEAVGSLLGIFPGETFTEGHAVLRSGDRLFLYTDGIELAFNRGEDINTNLWRHELYMRRTMPVEQVLADITQQIDGANGSLMPKDDLTMVVVEVK